LNGRNSSGPTTREAPEKQQRLSELGISHKQSSNWQRLAAVTQAIFDDELKHSPCPDDKRPSRPQRQERQPIQLFL
jgi:hypothetical protein